MFCQDFMFFRTYYFGQTLVFSKMLLFLWVWNKIPQPKWPHGPWDHFMVLVKNRLCIDILHSDTTFCEWPLFSIFLCNCMKKLCQCIRQHASCVKIRSMFSSKTIRSLWGALGSFWGALWSLMGALGSLWGALGSLWDALGSLWGAPGSLWGIFYNLVKKWTSNSEHLALKSAACHQKMTSRNSSAGIPGDPRGSADAHKVTFGPQLATPLHSRRGPGWREFITNSLK